MPHVPQPAPRHPLPEEEPVPSRPDPRDDDQKAGDLYVGTVGDLVWDASAEEVRRYRKDVERRVRARQALGGFGFRRL